MGRAEDLFHRIERDGVTAIDEFIEGRQSEELFLDFKRSSDNGTGRRLSDGDRGNLAKAISGFGNSAGGVIVWGIDCSSDATGADVARHKHPLVDTHRFKSLLEAAVSGCTIPPHAGVRHHPVTCEDGKSGFVATLIPESYSAPHQRVSQGPNYYYIRAGSDFVPAPHALLAGMFGRKPQPTLVHEMRYEPAILDGAKLSLRVALLIRNLGPVPANGLYLVLHKNSPGGGVSVGALAGDSPPWRTHSYRDGTVSFDAAPEFSLPPEVSTAALDLFITIMSPIEGDVEIDGLFGHSTGPPMRFQLQVHRESMSRVLNAALMPVGLTPAAVLARIPAVLLGDQDR